MAGDTVITVIGNLTADPELRFTPSGAPVSNYTVASTPRTFDREANEWRDGDTLFLRCTQWREPGENTAESLTKGTRVIVQGRLKARSYETKEGEKRTVTELDVDEIGPSLRYATAKVTRNARRGDEPAARPRQDDPWATGQRRDERRAPAERGPDPRDRREGPPPQSDPGFWPEERRDYSGGGYDR